MDEQAVSLNVAVGALSRANAASNALITPQTSLFFREILEKALANPVGIAPRWAAEAWALLANLLVNDFLHSWNHAGEVELNEAEDAMRNALAIDRSLTLAHHAKGLIYRARGNHQAAYDAFARAVELDQNFARAHAQLGNEWTLLGKPAEALACVNEAIRLSPYDPASGTFYWIKGRAHFVAAQSDDESNKDGQYAAAVRSLRESVERLPTFWYNWAYLISAYVALGQNENAESILYQFRSQSQFRELTLKEVKRYEKADPDDKPLIIKARRAVYEALKNLGLTG
jgi:tetratricopeptide (TPR) repeat protein